mgnify:CR=1 FL=1
MNNKILIFRTDRIGDLIVSCPAIITIKRSIVDSKITLIASKKNYDYAKSLNLFDEIYKFPEKNIFKKIVFIFKLIKKKYKYIYVFDGKERSIIAAGLIKSYYKLALTPKINAFYKMFKIRFFLDNEKTNLNTIFQQFLKYSNINVSISNFDFLKKKIDNNFSSKIPIRDYLHIHLDEKWSSNIYIKKYTDINPSFIEFIQFLDEINQKNDILITTGLIDFNLIEDLKTKYFEKLSDKIFLKRNGNKSIYLIYKPLFEDLESLLRRSKTLIACHGAITHAANSFNIKKIDILEKSKISFYSRFTSHLRDYHTVYRSNFNAVKSEIYKKGF